MKERPILFSAEMVRALLAGRKTQTRRVVKLPKTIDGTPDGNKADWDLAVRPSYCSDAVVAFYDRAFPVETYPTLSNCPYGQPGDFLWVRETWATWRSLDDISPVHILQKPGLEYRADGCLTVSGGKLLGRGKWRPSIFMPRWASRIMLKIKSVRVERVQEITDADALAEGVEPWPFGDRVPVGFMEIPQASVKPALKFAVLWDHINASRGCGWVTNPWVWVVEFERIQL